VEKKEAKRSPAPPFTTSKIQQEASRRLRFTAKKTMSVAQRLYEGIALGEEGSVGLITYMRTDSVRIASEALENAREYIEKNYGKEFLPAKARFFKASKSAQDAHEAIRPTTTTYAPQNIKQYLKNDEFRLYQLIWNRFIASQMNPVVFDQTGIDIQAGCCLFHAQGSIMKFPGFSIVYTEIRDKEDNGNDVQSDSPNTSRLPEVSKGDELTLISINQQQSFTQPPARFSEATLVKELEEKGIGRPSTYAAIISTIQNRKYAEIEKGQIPSHGTRDSCQWASCRELSQYHGCQVHRLHGGPAGHDRGGNAHSAQDTGGFFIPLSARSWKRPTKRCGTSNGKRHPPILSAISAKAPW